MSKHNNDIWTMARLWLSLKDMFHCYLEKQLRILTNNYNSSMFVLEQLGL